MPAVFFRLKYVSDWHIGDGDFLQYMTRPEAFDKKKHNTADDEFYDYIEYMRNDDKSDGAFDSDHDLLTDKQLDEYRKLEIASRDNGCVKYCGVMSFDNTFLKDNGYIATTLHGDEPDLNGIKNVARQSINALIEKSKKLDSDNVYWTAAIHTNTDNIHVHYSICEKERTREVGDDNIELDAIKALKSKSANMILGSNRSAEITAVKRQIIYPELTNALGGAQRYITQLVNKLPKDIAMQYGNHRMKAFQKDIDRCVDNILGSNEKLRDQFEQYKTKVNSMAESYEDFYGKGSEGIMYSENTMREFYKGAGNILLKHIKALRENTELENKDTNELDEILKKENIENASQQFPAINDLQKFLKANHKYKSYYKIAKELRDKLELLGGDELAAALAMLDKTSAVSDTAAFALGLYYDDKNNYPQAEKYLKLSADNENSDAQYRIAKLYLREKKNELGRHYMQLSADGGNAFAQFSYGMELYKRNKEGEGLYYLHKAADSGNKIAHNIIQKLQKHTDNADHKAIVKPSGSNNGSSDSYMPPSDNTDSYEYGEEDKTDCKPSDNAGSNKTVYLKWSNEYKEANKLLYDKKSKVIDFEQAEQMLLAEAGNGNVLAMDTLGRFYKIEKFGKKDTEKSEQFFKMAFDGFMEIEPSAAHMYPYEPKGSGSPKAVDMRSYVWYRIGKMYNYGTGTEKDTEQAFQWFEKSAKLGNKFAQFSLGNMYYYGSGAPQDYTKAFEWYLASAEQKQPYAAYAVAQMQAAGTGVDKDEAEAENFYKQALSGFLDLEAKGQADENLIYRIGTMYKQGLGTDVDMTKAVDYISRAADLSNNNAQYEYGKMLLKGESVTQDISKAEKYLQKALAQGNANAKRLLAAEYLTGDRIRNKTEMGIRYSTELASSGDMLAAYRLGKFYLKNKDSEKAEKWLRFSAEGGNKFGQLTYGIMLAKQGKLAQSNEYLKKAYENGVDFAMEIMIRRRRVASVKRPAYRQARIVSDRQSSKCWRALEQIMSEYERHIKKLQAEFDSNNSISEEYEYENEIYRS